MTGGDAPQTLHATALSVQGCGLLILGPSGAGKSALALQMMAMGAALVADDRTRIWVEDDVLMAGAPHGLPPLIEARFIGLLRVPALTGPVPVSLAVDLGQTETQRLPPLRHHSLLGCAVPLVFHSAAAHFPAGLMHYLRHGREA